MSIDGVTMRFYDGHDCDPDKIIGEWIYYGPKGCHKEHDDYYYTITEFTGYEYEYGNDSFDDFDDDFNNF